MEEDRREQMKDYLRGLLPNLITFSGLVCAFSAVVLAMHEELTASGACILAGCLLDALDGEVARRTGATSAFGLQLDSLVDIVTFGVAPSVLIYQYLRQLAFSPPSVPAARAWGSPSPPQGRPWRSVCSPTAGTTTS
jgi:phosphatidylserine synthase